MYIRDFRWRVVKVVKQLEALITLDDVRVIQIT